MAKYGYFRLEHSSVNRADKGDGYLAASANYAANQNKCSKVIHVNMAENRHAIRDYIQRHEEGTTRKNARLGDKILLSLPVELSQSHREEAGRRFLWAITGEGRSRAVAFYHGDKPGNPHFHVLLLDRDVFTGEPVALMGANRKNRLKAGLEPNATNWLRKLWERECNSVLSQFGYDIVMDRRTNLERGLPEPGEHIGYDGEQPTNDNHVGDVTEMVSEPVPADSVDAPLRPDTEFEPEDGFEASSPPEEAEDGDVAAQDYGYIEYPNLSFERPADAIKIIYLARQDLSEARLAKERLEEAEAKYAARVAARQKAEEAASAHLAEKLEPARQNAYQAQADFAAHQTSRGGLKGFGVRLFGLELKTRARKLAEVALDRVETQQQVAQRFQQDQEAYDREVGVAHSLALAAEREAENRRNHILGVYGSEKDMEATQRTFENTVAKAREGLTMEMATEALAFEGVTLDEFRAYLEATGNQAVLDAYDEGLAMNKGESL